MMGLRVCVGWTVAALTLALVAGCGATVTLADESGPGGEGPGGSAPAPCTDPPPSDVTLRVEGPATIIGDRLHLTGSVDGTDGYFVPRLDQGALWFSGGPVDLQGPARWVPFFDDMGTRVRGGEGAEPLVAELLDTSQPEAPKVLVTAPLGGEVPGAYRGTFSVHEGRLLFCRQQDPGGAMQLVSTGPELQAPIATPHNGCSPFYHASAAQGRLLVSWTLGVGSDSGSINVSDLAQGGQNVVSFGFAPNGVHQYGGINGAGTDGARVVVSTDNDGWMLVFDAHGLTGPSGPYVAFSPAGPKRLLAVLDEVAYFATPTRVVAYDLHDLSAPALLAEQAEADWDPAAIAFVVANETTIFVRDELGQLWSVPRALVGKVTPTPAYQGDPVNLPEPCSE